MTTKHFTLPLVQLKNNYSQLAHRIHQPFPRIHQVLHIGLKALRTSSKALNTLPQELHTDLKELLQNLQLLELRTDSTVPSSYQLKQEFRIGWTELQLELHTDLKGRSIGRKVRRIWSWVWLWPRFGHWKRKERHKLRMDGRRTCWLGGIGCWGRGVRRGWARELPGISERPVKENQSNFKTVTNCFNR